MKLNELYEILSCGAIELRGTSNRFLVIDSVSLYQGVRFLLPRHVDWSDWMGCEVSDIHVDNFGRVVINIDIDFTGTEERLCKELGIREAMPLDDEDEEEFPKIVLDDCEYLTGIK